MRINNNGISKGAGGLWTPGLKEGIYLAGKTISTAIVNILEKWNDSGLRRHYLWYRLFVPSIFDFEDVDPQSLQGDYIVIGYDRVSNSLFIWDPREDRFFKLEYRFGLPICKDALYVWCSGNIECVYVWNSDRFGIYQNFGSAVFIPFVWFQVLRDIFVVRDPSYICRLPDIEVDKHQLRFLSHRYRRGRYKDDKKEMEMVANMFEGRYVYTDHDIVVGRFFEGVYMVLSVEENKYSVRMLLGQVLPSELSHLRGFFVFETEKIFCYGSEPLTDCENFWRHLFVVPKPCIVVYDHIWGAFFLGTDLNCLHDCFWRHVFLNFRHQAWYIPKNYWEKVIGSVRVLDAGGKFRHY